MEVINRVVPNEEQIKGFMEPGREGPIYMLNLLKFKAKFQTLRIYRIVRAVKI